MCKLNALWKCSRSAMHLRTVLALARGSHRGRILGDCIPMGPAALQLAGPSNALIAVVLAATPSSAQTNGTFLLTSSNIVSPATPSTTVEIWATWEDPGRTTLFGGADYDLTAGDGIFSDPVNVLNGPGSSAGIANGNTITGGANGQILCGIVFCSGSTENPIRLASYTWTATDFTLRTVSLVTTNTNNFIVADRVTYATLQLYPGAFTPGLGSINVVPATATWVLFAVSLAVGTRRRRVNGPNAKQD
jgi:hypothetical protein